jgi:hypothetical protein
MHDKLVKHPIAKICDMACDHDEVDLSGRKSGICQPALYRAEMA